MGEPGTVSVVRFTLQPHPAAMPHGAMSVAGSVSRFGDRVGLRYLAQGSAIRLAASQPAQRTDGLWRTTCLELFVGRPAEYEEYNFAVSGAWAAYAFDGYRLGMQPLDLAAPPSIVAERTEGGFSLDVQFALPAGRQHLALAAVIEETDGTKSYWALVHPNPDKPDFHHPDSFVLTLPA